MAETAPIPILFISDAPSAGSGLGRITGDIARRAHEHLGDVCRVAVLGYGGPGSCKLGFQQYAIEGMTDWMTPTLPQVWEDFAGEKKGICMTVWDASRLLWFSQPSRFELLETKPDLRRWLVDAPFKRWGYFPIDADGPNGKLSFALHQTLLGFDRLLAYGEWGQQVIERTIKEDDDGKGFDLANLSHGIDTDVFYPRLRVRCRFRFGSITGARTMIKTPQLSSIMADETLIGIVATNQARKDWSLGIATAAELAKIRKLRLWIHTDALERHWSIPSLLADYGLLDQTMISLGFLTDDSMAEAYTACDLTLGIGLGEGWGYPLAESLACGTPVIHGNYAGGAEIVPEAMRVEPIAYHSEGLYACVRPVFNVDHWVARAVEFLGQRATLDPRFAWSNLWPHWETWFRSGLAQ